MAGFARTRTKAVWLLASVLALVLVAPNPPKPARARPPLIIAVAGPMTGVYAKRFKAVLDGVKEALSNHSSHTQTRVVAYDDGCQAAKARALANEIVGSNAALVIGHPCTSAAQAAKAIYAHAGLLFIGVGANAPGDTQATLAPATFSIVRRSDNAPAHTAQNLAKIASGKQIALIHDRTEFARTLTRAIAASLQDHHATLPMIHSIEAAQRTYNKMAHTVAASNIGVVHFSGFPSEARLLINELETAHAQLTFIGSETLLTPEFIAFLESRATNPATPQASIKLGITVPFKAGSSQIFKNARRAHEVITLLKRNSLQADAYAATEIWIAASQKAGSTNGPEIARAIQTGRFKTRIGEIKFDEKGIANRPWSAIAIFDGNAWMPATAIAQQP